MARNSIWREHVGKEKREFQPGGTFQLFDPNRLATVVHNGDRGHLCPGMCRGVWGGSRVAKRTLKYFL